MYFDKSAGVDLYAIIVFDQIKHFEENECPVWLLFNKPDRLPGYATLDIAGMLLGGMNIRVIFGDTLIRIYKIKYVV